MVADGGGKNVPAEAAKLAVDTFLLSQNVERRAIRSISYTRRWSPANQAVYQLSSGKDYAG